MSAADRPDAGKPDAWMDGAHIDRTGPSSSVVRPDAGKSADPDEEKCGNCGRVSAALLSMTPASINDAVIAALTEWIPGYRHRDQYEPRIAKVLKMLGHGGRYCPKVGCFGYRCPDNELLARCLDHNGLRTCRAFNASDE